MVIVVRFEPSLPSRAIPGADQFQERPFVGAMAYELESVEVEGVDVAAVLAWAETGHPMVRAGSA
jgi:TPP-dependent pyruvate/acetoin dehydrogenase alpha subunit